MVNTVVEKNLISFKISEQKIFAYVCELGREITRILNGKQVASVLETKREIIKKNEKTANDHLTQTRVVFR